MPSRVSIPLVVLDATGAPKSGASVTVKKRSDNTNATIYTTEGGGTTTANPMSTDAVGRLAGWVDRGAYNLIVTGSGITGFTEAFDAAPASDGAVIGPWVGTEILPLGSVVPYAAGADPTGGQWLLCNGRAISRSTYAALFAAISTAFGTGDGSTTFNIPDLTGRVPLGAGTPSANSGGEVAMEGATAHTLAKKAGKEKHTLSGAESGEKGHGHRVVGSNEGGAPPGAPAGGIIGSQYSGAGGSSYSIAPTTLGSFTWALIAEAIAASSAAGAHENLPPHLVLNHIIRVL